MYQESIADSVEAQKLVKKQKQKCGQMVAKQQVKEIVILEKSGGPTA